MSDQQESEDSELERIRKKKMQELLNKKKQQEQTQQHRTSLEDKVDFVLKTVLAPDAYQHLNRLKQNEPRVYQYIRKELVGDDVVQNIDLLIMLIRRQGGVPRKIPRDVIVYLERQAKGVKSKIKVKRGDEMMDLGSYIKKD
jgi:DNA-binding TFAR19-related protein (PDSD5 family)